MACKCVVLWPALVPRVLKLLVHQLIFWSLSQTMKANGTVAASGYDSFFATFFPGMMVR